MDINEPYIKLFGYIPELTQKRHEFTNEVYPEILEIQEKFRELSIHSKALDDKTVQLILFGILSSHMREGARVHVRAARKLAATWKELHAVSNLVFLFSGLPAMNFSIKILNEEKQSEESDIPK